MPVVAGRPRHESIDAVEAAAIRADTLLTMFARRTWRPLLALIAILVPFCACHAVLFVGSGTGCCLNDRSTRCGIAMAPIVRQSLEIAASERERGCAAGCCGASSTTDGFETSAALAPVDDAANSVPVDPSPHRHLPGCSDDTCCVKSVPQDAPWQLPALLLVAFVQFESISTCASMPRAAIDWPPTLPLGQPPTPLDRGTLLLV